MNRSCDIVVIGGGHAGVEAAFAASQFGLNVIIVTLKGVSLASAPCNPSIGGIGKGQVVREIDAMGGLMGILADRAGIQYRTLNESKGVAVQSTRIQIDKYVYSQSAEEIISNTCNISVVREQVKGIKTKVDSNSIIISLGNGKFIECRKVILTTGTFLSGVTHCGSKVMDAGREGAVSSCGLSSIFQNIELSGKRFKTGTPPRIIASSINFAVLEEQPSDINVRNMHLWNECKGKRTLPQRSCYLTRTNSSTLGIIRANKESSPMYNGQISGIGARYCPSIEDKAYRYPDKDSHHVFLEPEESSELTYYPSGISTSLPIDIQNQFIRTIAGLDNAVISKHGYAVEYDVIDTCQLDLTLQLRECLGVYFAGQVNGTSGYEEAAGQGLVAGINAALSCLDREPLILSRTDSYIGLMIDDLVSSERDEPYRLFTARSENRLFLREDNAFLRMSGYREQLELNSTHDERLRGLVCDYLLCSKWITDLSFDPDLNNILREQGFMSVENRSPADILRDPTLDPRIVIFKVCEYYGVNFSDDAMISTSIAVKYDGYLKKDIERSKYIAGLERRNLDIDKIINSSNVSFECKQRISKFRPQTFGQLRRMAGIRPATLAVVATGNL